MRAAWCPRGPEVAAGLAPPRETAVAELLQNMKAMRVIA